MYNKTLDYLSNVRLDIWIRLVAAPKLWRLHRVLGREKTMTLWYDLCRCAFEAARVWCVDANKPNDDRFVNREALNYLKQALPTITK